MEIAMIEVNITEFRNHLPEYLGQVKQGEDIFITSRGKVIARVTPVTDERAAARGALMQLRERCRIGDVISPLDDKWEACDAGS
jgi:prevent-host-death family protein